MKIIGVEEHLTRGQLDNMESRLQMMDEAGVDMAVLSCIFPYDKRLGAAEAISLAKDVNNRLSATVKKYPERFASFAALPLHDPVAAADELERAVSELGLKGTMIFSDLPDEFLDAPKYRVVLERAAKLKVPIYVHPGSMPEGMAKSYSTYPILVGAMWGYAALTGLHAMRLMMSGIFDDFPELKVILGHMGEAIPYWLWRIDNQFKMQKDTIFKNDVALHKLQKTPGQYFKDNFYISTSGVFWTPALQFNCLVVGAEHILFAVDSDQESSKDAVQFIKSTPINDSDKEKICHLNTEKLLSL